MVVIATAIRVIQVKTPVLMGADVTQGVKNVCQHVIVMVNGLKNVLRQEIVAKQYHVALNVAMNVLPLRQVMEKIVPVGNVKPLGQQRGLRIPVIRVQGSVKPARLVLMC